MLLALKPNPSPNTVTLEDPEVAGLKRLSILTAALSKKSFSKDMEFEKMVGTAYAIWAKINCSLLIEMLGAYLQNIVVSDFHKGKLQSVPERINLGEKLRLPKFEPLYPTILYVVQDLFASA
jgi:hypothetical protein